MRENLKNARKEKGLTQQEVADLLRERGIFFKMRYDNSLIVCSNGNIYKKCNDGLYRLTQTELNPSSRYLYVPIRVNETDINPPAELGRLTDASGDKQSTRI